MIKTCEVFLCSLTQAFVFCFLLFASTFSSAVYSMDNSKVLMVFSGVKPEEREKTGE